MKTLIRPLGLAHRAVALIKALSEIANHRNTLIPDQEDQLQKIFGIGKYIARAILTFGFGRRVGIVDPNIARVLIRYFHLEDIPRRVHTSVRLWALADIIVSSCSKAARLINWGLLDVGREICLPSNPKSTICPFNKFCRFHNEGITQ